MNLFFIYSLFKTENVFIFCILICLSSKIEVLHCAANCFLTKPKKKMFDFLLR